jgi:hypothetical protein
MSTNTRRKSYSKECNWLTRSSTKVRYSNRDHICASYQLFNDNNLVPVVFPVSAPQEATLDSAFLLTASNMHAAKARAMKAGAGAFDIDDFVSKLITFMGGRRGGGGGGGAEPKDRERRPHSQADADYDEDVDDDEEEDDDEDDEPLNWERIGRKALAKSRRIPVMDFMCVHTSSIHPFIPFFPPSPWRVLFYLLVESRDDRLGPLAIEQKKRAVGKRARFEKNKEDERKPQELREEDIARSENETTKNVIDVSIAPPTPHHFPRPPHPDAVCRFEACSWNRTDQ